MNRIITTLVIAVVFITSAYSQQAIIKGRVTDKNNKEPLIGASVVAGKSGIITDLDGNYHLEVAAGTYTLKLSYTGYDPAEQEVTVKAGETKELILELAESVTPLQEATVTGDKFEKPLGEQVISLDVLKPRLIENYSASTIDKVLDKLPGVEVIDGQANIRGGSGFSGGAGSRVMMLMDDLPSLQGDLGLSQWDDVPVELIDRVEVLKGAASSLYGSAALNGVINIRTISPTATPVTKAAAYTLLYTAPDNPSQKWWGDANPFQSGMMFAHSQKWGRFGLVLGANAMYEKGFVENSYTRRNRVTLKLSYNISDKVLLSLNTMINTGAEGYFFYWANAGAGQLKGLYDNGSFITGNHTRIFVDPSITIFDKKNNRHKIMGRISNIHNGNNGDKGNTHEMYYGEYQFQGKYDQYGLTTVAGVAAYHVHALGDVIDHKNYYLANFSPYLQVDWKPFKNFTLSGGVRYEYNHLKSPDSIKYATGNIANPQPDFNQAKTVFRLGANYRLSNATYIRASYGQGYRFPTIGEKFIYTNAGFPIYPNPALKSETGWSSEIGIKQGWNVADMRGFLDLSGFVMNYDNMIEYLLFGADPNLPIYGIQAANVGDTRIYGFEASAAGEGKIGRFPFNMIIGYTYLDPKYKNFTDLQRNTSTSTENVLKYRFRNSIKFDWESVFDKLTVGFTAIFRSRIEAIDKLFYLAIPNAPDGTTYQSYQENLSGKWVLDLRATYNLSKHNRISLLVKNFTNTEYQIRPAKPEAPRNVTLRLDCTF